MTEIDHELAHFFAWARTRAYAELDARLASDPALDPNWTFSEIMQELLEDYRQMRGLRAPEIAGMSDRKDRSD
jgi:hypothetical protein